MSEQPYDPYIPSGANGAGAGASAAQNGDPRTREIDKVSCRNVSRPTLIVKQGSVAQVV